MNTNLDNLSVETVRNMVVYCCLIIKHGDDIPDSRYVDNLKMKLALDKKTNRLTYQSEMAVKMLRNRCKMYGLLKTDGEVVKEEVRKANEYLKQKNGTSESVTDKKTELSSEEQCDSSVTPQCPQRGTADVQVKGIDRGCLRLSHTFADSECVTSNCDCPESVTSYCEDKSECVTSIKHCEPECVTSNCDCPESVTSIEEVSGECVTSNCEDNSESVTSNKQDATLIETLMQQLKGEGRKWKCVLSGLLSLADIINARLSLGVKTFTLSSRACDMTVVFRHPEGVKRIIDRAIAFGLITCVGTETRFGGKRAASVARSYVAHEEVIAAIQHIGVTENVNPKVTCNTARRKVKESTEEVKQYLEKVLRFGKIKFELGDVDFRQHEGLMESILHKKYPLIVQHQEMCNSINGQYYRQHPEQWLKMKVKFVWSKKVKNECKIGIRCTSSMCNFASLKKAEKIAERLGGEFRRNWKTKYREDYLDKRLGKGWYEWDVKSSIYRVADCINSGEWKANDVDFYPLLADREFETKEERDRFKLYAMMLYFNSSPRAASVAWSNKLKEIWWEEQYIVHGNQDEERHEFVQRKEAEGVKPQINKTENVKEDWNRMREVLGKGCVDSEIFLHESCLYLRLAKALLDRGIDVVQVYDGFYSNDERLASTCEELLPSIVEGYFREIKGEWSNPPNDKN